MKYYFTSILLFILFSLSSFGQERVNRTKVKFNHEGIILNKIVGWAYDDETGEWIDWNNCIKTLKLSKRYRMHTPNDAIFMSNCFNNIISLQFKTIELNNTPYYVLIWEKYNGAYKYPNIREDWLYWKEKIFLIFTEDNMEKLRNLTATPITLALPSSEKSEVGKVIKDEDIIQTSINSKFPITRSLIIYKATDGCSIRFKFIKDLHDKDIKKQYFEISETDFKKFINIRP